MSVLEERGLLNCSREELSILLGAIAQEAHQSVAKETNMDGIIYAEDALTGRSPSASGVDTEGLNVSPKRILTNYDIEVIGSLCLRHPLPAVVFSSFVPQENFILIDNTTTSLGFDLPMFFSTLKRQQLHESLFVLSGKFYIPVPDERFGSHWNRVIQNSAHFYSELKVQTGSSIIEITVEW